MSLPPSRRSMLFIPASLFLILMIPGVVTGQSLPKQESREPSRSTEVRCLIRIDSSSWKQDGPALVHVTLENLTDGNLHLAIVPELFLKNGREAYTAPIDIVHNKPLDVSRRPIAKGSAVSIKPVPLKIRLGKGSSADFCSFHRFTSSCLPYKIISLLTRFK